MCSVVACSGDNPCAFAGLGLSQPGDLGVSLGTSDTVRTHAMLLYIIIIHTSSRFI